jgi:hypothetical protein
MLNQAAGTRVADTAFAASRQVWLAGLGAAIVTREWARNDAGDVFRALVREGSAVEARARRMIGRRFESSLALANTAWNRTRDTARATVNGLVKSTAAALPRVKVPIAGKKTAGQKRRPAKQASRKPRRGKRS